MNQSLMHISARIKLRNRHLSEWYALADNHQAVWQLVQEETDKKLAACNDDKLACLKLKRKQNSQLIKIMVQQRQEREQMKVRNQQEFLLLEQASKTPK